MSVVLVTGASGLVGSESVRYFSELGYEVVGIDNNLRQTFFGRDGSTEWNRRQLQDDFPSYRHLNVDIRDHDSVRQTFARLGGNIALVIHAAAQPSHDYAAADPLLDFSVNAGATALLLECTRQSCPDAVFIFTSSNKVYGDRPNRLALEELPSRYDLPPDHRYHRGIDEHMPIDRCLHSIFGASKIAADVLTQEYGRYFGLRTGVFRGGCLTGPGHAGARLHGFLSYLVRCFIRRERYQILGYSGKQVRDNLHVRDLVTAFEAFFRSPRAGEVYNIGGGRGNAVSLLEAFELCERLFQRSIDRTYSEESRIGDHIWWISDTGKFQSHYPSWAPRFSTEDILLQIQAAQRQWNSALETV